MPPKRDPSKLRQVATDFWFAVQRMGRHGDDPPGTGLVFEPPPDDDPTDDPSGSGVPRNVAPSSGSAAAAITQASEETD